MHPLLVNRLIYPVIERIKGKPTHARLRELERTERLSPEALGRLQLERLRAHLEFAHREVPYYQRIFDERGFRPADVRSLNDLARLPFLTKETIRRHCDDLQPRAPARRVTRMTTGDRPAPP